MLSLWTRVRRLLWSWWPWAALCVWSISHNRWGWAIATGGMALASHLIAPRALPPRFGLDHEFAVGSDDFVHTVAGASGVRFLEGNTVALLNNGDAFYPRMLQAIGHSPSPTIDTPVLSMMRWIGPVASDVAEHHIEPLPRRESVV